MKKINHDENIMQPHNFLKSRSDGTVKCSVNRKIIK